MFFFFLVGQIEVHIFGRVLMWFSCVVDNDMIEDVWEEGSQYKVGVRNN
jgi:hypothetical protein